MFFPAPYTAVLPSSAAGDSNVPAGEVTWRAAAAALPTPWPEQEAQMVNLRQQMVAATAESAAHLAGMLVSWWDDSSHYRITHLTVVSYSVVAPHMHALLPRALLSNLWWSALGLLGVCMGAALGSALS